MADCPICGNQGSPSVDKQVSMNGWIVFIVLIIFCIPLCWIPFVVDGLKEQVYRCRKCGAKLGTG